MYLPGIRQGPEAYGYRSGAWKARPLSRIVACVWHTTGSGIISRFERDPDKYGSPFGAALWVFRNQKAGAHFVIGQGPGELMQIAPVNVSAWHVGKARSWAYRNTKRGMSASGRYGWWRERWHPRGIQKPAALAGGMLWHGGQCNPNTVGIEIVPPQDAPRGPWSEHCWDSIQRVAHAVRDTLGVPLEPEYQVGHSDAHPHARTSKRKPYVGWDPSPSAWDPWAHCARVG